MSNTFQIVGAIAGLAGIAVLIFYLCFREFINQKFFPKLSRNQAYNIIRLFIVLLFAVTLASIGAWYFKAVNQTTNNNSSVPNYPKEQTTPPLIGELKVFNPGAVKIEVKSKGATMLYDAIWIEQEPDEFYDFHYDEPFDPLDFAIYFDITNTAAYDLRIDGIYINVFEWTPLEEIIDCYLTVTGVEYKLKYRCLINKELNEYPAVFKDVDKYVKLSPGETEYIEIEVKALTEGIYKFEVILDYSLGGIISRIKVGHVDPTLFLDPANPQLPESMEIHVD